jgi:trehalose 6-phosphate synthase/phosphatase
MALPVHAQVMAAELKEVLMSLISGKDLEIIDGNKVIEVRVAGINKGIASSRFIEDADFILAAGDDWTDEDMFEAMPEHAWTIKVGPKPSKAKWIVEDVDEMRKLLNELSALDTTK